MKLVCDTIIPPLPTTERGCGIHLDGTLVKEPRMIYCSNNLVIQRNLENVNQCRINPEHSVKAKVAKFSPNGEWICSGDESGQCAVWAHRSFVVKNTISVGKCVLDCAWSHDGQRIVAVGRGKDDKGKVFPWNTNNKLGELSGAQKGFLCCDFKPSRPFRVITGSEDYGVYFYKGPPFKFETYSREHKNYINDVRYRPDGSCYLSVSSDKQILQFDGKTGEFQRKICDGKGKNSTHKGTIYSLSFNKDGTKFITSSADKTCKVWDFETGKVEFTYKFADKPTLFDMQVSCLWLDGYILSLSLSGRINYLDSECKQERPIKILTGHRKSINDLDIDYKNNTLYSIDGDSRIVRTECKTCECSDIYGTERLKNAVLKYVKVTCNGNSYYTVASDDTFTLSLTSDNKFSEKSTKIDGSARELIVGKTNENLCIIPTHRNKIEIINGMEIKKSMDIGYSPTCGDISSDDKFFVIGGDDKNVYFYDVDDCKEIQSIKSAQYIRGALIKVSISPNNEFIATADAQRAIWIWDYKNKKFDEPLNKTSGMKFHGGKISSLNWSPSAPYKLVSTSFDSTIILWTAPTDGKNDYCKLEPKENVLTFVGAVKKMLFLTDNRMVGMGDDTTIRFFNIEK